MNRPDFETPPLGPGGQGLVRFWEGSGRGFEGDLGWFWDGFGKVLEVFWRVLGGAFGMVLKWFRNVLGGFRRLLTNPRSGLSRNRVVGTAGPGVPASRVHRYPGIPSNGVYPNLGLIEFGRNLALKPDFRPGGTIA